MTMLPKRRNLSRRSLLAVAAVVVAGLAGVPTTSPATAAPRASLLANHLATSTPTVPAALGTCTEVRRPFALDPGGAADSSLAGTLCRPKVWGSGSRTVDVLVHGGMYNRRYWDWPVRPETYSYVRRTLGAGRAVYFYDRLGAGESTHLRSREASFRNDVDALHEAVGWLRQTYPRVNTVGHSLGSVVALQEAGMYRDVDKLVLTGLTHGHGLGFLLLPANIWPANLDPQFSEDLTLRDTTYLTTIPGRRGPLFYSSTAEADVIAWDEANKDMMTLSQTRQAIVELTLLPLLNISNKVTAPVLMVNGTQDLPFCNVDVSCLTDAALRRAELPYFGQTRSFTARVVPDTGHDLPLHPSAGVSFGIIDAWLRSP